MIFIDNASTKRYYEIIEMAKLFPHYGYTEKHHIIPRSFYKSKNKTGWLDGNPNDPNDPDNLVVLTGREHFICHQLLTQMLSKEHHGYYKMLHAFFGMCRTSSSQKSRYIPTPDEYEIARELNVKAQKAKLGQKYKPMSNEGKLICQKHTWVNADLLSLY